VARTLFLLVSGGAFLVACALPLLFAPFAWARAFRWYLPRDTDLAIDFGRCLGAVATAICAACFVAAPHPEENVILFDVIGIVGVLMVGVHGWGAVRKVQPWTETAEIPLYALLAVVAFALRP
jgi:hypothetical protein